MSVVGQPLTILPIAATAPAAAGSEPLVEQPAALTAMSTEDATAANRARGALLAAVFDVLDRDGLAYCVLHGYQAYPHEVTSDVDLLVPREMLPRRLGELLRA